MLGQTFYTLSDVDRSVLGSLAQPVRAAIVTEVQGSTASLHVLMPNPARPVVVRNGVRAGNPGQPGTWNAVAP